MATVLSHPTGRAARRLSDRVAGAIERRFERAGAWVDDTLLEEDRLLAADAAGRRRVLRQPWVNRLVHWLVALATFSLFFSGFGQMPLYKRYMLSEVPGLAWTADYGVTLVLHYLGAAVLIFAVAFHVLHHGLFRRAFGFVPRRGDVGESAKIIRAMVTGGPEPPSAKYLAEQRLAYAAIGGALALLIVTGLVKVAKNLPGVGLPEIVIEAATHLHNLGAIVLLLLIVAHLAAFLVPANRALVGAMFHGRVDRNYVEHRHPLWYRELRRRAEAPIDVTSVDTSAPLVATAPVAAAPPAGPALAAQGPAPQPTPEAVESPAPIIGRQPTVAPATDSGQRPSAAAPVPTSPSPAPLAAPPVAQVPSIPARSSSAPPPLPAPVAAPARAPLGPAAPDAALRSSTPVPSLPAAPDPTAPGLPPATTCPTAG